MNIQLTFRRNWHSRWLTVDYEDAEAEAQAAYESVVSGMEHDGKVHTVKLLLIEEEEEVEIRSHCLDLP